MGDSDGDGSGGLQRALGQDRGDGAALDLDADPLGDLDGDEALAQVLDAAGDAVYKLHARAATDLDAWAELVATMTSANQSADQPVEPIDDSETRADAPVASGSMPRRVTPQKRRHERSEHLDVVMQIPNCENICISNAVHLGQLLNAGGFTDSMMTEINESFF